MSAEFRMPSLGADMQDGTLVEWLVRPGQQVRKGDIVAVVDTAKADVEVECFTSGVVDQLLVTPGTKVPVGTVLATITAAPSEPEPPHRPPEPRPSTAAAVPPTGTAASPVTSPLVRRLAGARHVDLAAVHGTGPGGRVTHADVETAAAPLVRPAGRVSSSPLARRLAQQLGLALAGIAGSGPDGAVRARDVQAAAQAGPGPGTPDRTAAVRAQIAVSMARSKREIPHYYLSETIDLDAALRWLHDRNRQTPVAGRVLPAAMLLKAATMAVREVPDVNGAYTETGFHRAEHVHLGVAISLRGGGLVAPAIHDADKLSLDDLMTALKDLATRTRAGRLRAGELADATITVSNLGEQGVETIHGVIYPPQVALVGFGAVMQRPWAVDGMLGIRPLVTASLAADHRVTDGVAGARYLRTISRLLQTPEEWR